MIPVFAAVSDQHRKRPRPTIGDMSFLDEPQGPSAPQGPQTQSSTGLLERTEVEQEKSPGDGDRFAHFVRRDKADSSMGKNGRNWPFSDGSGQGGSAE